VEAYGGGGRIRIEVKGKTGGWGERIYLQKEPLFS
jgi:hypothetical protein